MSCEDYFNTSTVLFIDLLTLDLIPVLYWTEQMHFSSVCMNRMMTELLFWVNIFVNIEEISVVK